VVAVLSVVSKSYGAGENRVVALNNVSLEFRPGTFTAIMGPSGSGKSMLLQCAAGLDRVDSGSVQLAVGVVGQKWFEDPVFFANTMAAHLSPGANALAVAADADAVQHAVGNGPVVLSGSALQQADPDPTGGSDELLNAQAMAATTGAIAVCVAMFIVFATFAFVVEQRSREMALLRLIGATLRQIRQMVRAESLLIGLAGTVTGCALGCTGAHWLGQWMISNGIAPSWFHISVNLVPLLIAAALGIAAAVLGAAAVALRVTSPAGRCPAGGNSG
jgi:putative ABC transport system permease protein